MMCLPGVKKVSHSIRATRWMVSTRLELSPMTSTTIRCQISNLLTKHANFANARLDRRYQQKKVSLPSFKYDWGGFCLTASAVMDAYGWNQFRPHRNADEMLVVKQPRRQT